MVRCILLDEKKTLPCSVYLDGEYSLKDVYCGVPAVLSANGVEKIVDIGLDEDELGSLHRSAAMVRENIDKIM